MTMRNERHQQSTSSAVSIAIQWVHLLPLSLLLPTQQSLAFSFTNNKSDSSLIRNIRQISVFSQQRKTTNASYASTTSRSRLGIQMRDMSSANIFKIGDKVKVVSSVLKAGVELKGKIGTVQETWEKCEVDPTCCCAEFVDENFAVNVKFIDENAEFVNSNVSIAGLNDYYTHFFAEDELLKVQMEEEIVASF